METFYIRDMLLVDIPRIVDIENASFEFPWTAEEFSKCLKRKTIYRDTYGLVAEQKEIVVGYIVYQLHRRRAHILNVATHNSYRKRGICTSLISTLKRKLEITECCKKMVLEVRETNLPAQLTFKQLGFRATSVLRDFYDTNQESAFAMQFELESKISV